MLMHEGLMRRFGPGYTSTLIEQPDGFKEYITIDRKTVCTDFVHRVLCGVVVSVVWSVIEIDYIDGRYAALNEGQVVVFHRFVSLEEVALEAKFLCSLSNQAYEPFS